MVIGLTHALMPSLTSFAVEERFGGFQQRSWSNPNDDQKIVLRDSDLGVSYVSHTICFT